jgi:ribonucleoside-diphosphate reductase alpha chain
MRIERRFTTAGQSPYASIEFRAGKSEIRNPDGSVVFSLDDIEVPAAWSQASLRPARRRLGLLGLEGRLFRR